MTDNTHDFFMTLKTNYGRTYSESAVVDQRGRLIRAKYFLTTAGDIKKNHRFRTAVGLISEFSSMLCAC